jgi:leucine dehydrogenase
MSLTDHGPYFEKNTRRISHKTCAQFSGRDKMMGDPNFDDHESVVSVEDAETGLAGIIAIHSTALGPAAGGCRMATYVSKDAALVDALRLSRGMSYKNALAELPAGGGKAVLYKVDPGVSRTAVFEAFGSAVNELVGQYITAEDVGTSVADMQAVAHRTKFVSGLPNQSGLAGGDPSPWTALGVFVALEAAFGQPLRGARVAVQGLGSVGFKLCARLHSAGARLVVADVDRERTSAAEHAFNADIEPIDRIWEVDADVFSPNALGAGLNVDTIPAIKARLICGGANNQLASPSDGIRLFERGITYAPDYLVSAGGIINVMAEYFGEPGSMVEARVRKIGERTRSILEQARATGCPPHEVADRLAQERIGRRAAQSAA